MKQKKRFDCVEMKREIQAKLLDEHRHLGGEEFERRRREWLEKSEDPLALWWRSLKPRRREPARDETAR